MRTEVTVKSNSSIGKIVRKKTLSLALGFLCASGASSIAAPNQVSTPTKTSGDRSVVKKKSEPASNASSKKSSTKMKTEVKAATSEFPISATDKKNGKPTEAGELFLKGWSAWTAGHNLIRAKKYFKEGLAHDAGSASCNFGMWCTGREVDGENPNLKYLNAALLRDPNYPAALLHRAFIYKNKGAYKHAIDVFTKLISLNPKDAENYAYRGNAYFDYDDIAKARADLVVAHTMAPENLETLRLKAELQFYDGQYQWVRFNCNKILLADADASTYFLRCKANTRLFDFFAARSDLKLAQSKGWSAEDMAWYKERINNYEYDHTHAETDPAKRWALACSAPMFEFNNQGIESLAGAEPTLARRADELKRLASWWGVISKDGLIKNIEELKTQGMHNPKWMRMRAMYKQNPSQYEEQAKGDVRLMLIKQYGDKFGDAGILAFDLSRVISLCRWGYISGYLSEDEAFKLMLPAVVRIQKSYSNWDDFVDGYFVGRRFWSPHSYSDEPARVDRVQHLLKTAPGILHAIPWSTKLVYLPSKPKPASWSFPWESK